MSSSHDSKVAGRASGAGVSRWDVAAIIVVVGILFSLLMPAVQSSGEPSHRNQCMNNLKQLALAARIMKRQKSSFPWAVGATTGSAIPIPAWGIINPVAGLTRSCFPWSRRSLDRAARRPVSRPKNRSGSRLWGAWANRQEAKRRLASYLQSQESASDQPRFVPHDKDWRAAISDCSKS